MACTQLIDTDTEIQVTYEYTGLSEKGSQFIKEFTSSEYKEFIAEWKSLLDTYFTTKR